MKAPELCPRASNGPFIERKPCKLEAVRTGATHIRMLTVCVRCGWVDPAALDRWFEQAYKEKMDRLSQQISMASIGTPFTFVRSPDEDITLKEGVFQALGAASMCWSTLEGAGEFDSTRAKQIGDAVILLIREFVTGKVSAG